MANVRLWCRRLVLRSAVLGVAVMGVSGLTASPLHANDTAAVPDAASLLQRLQQPADAPDVAAEHSAVLRFKRDLPNLNPEDAGRRWAEVAAQTTLTEALTVIPGPASWDAFAAAAAEQAKAPGEDREFHRRGVVLQLLGAVLQNQRDALPALLKEYERLTPGTGVWPVAKPDPSVDRLRKLVDQPKGRSALEEFKAELADEDSVRFGEYLSIPDLLSHADVETVRPLLKQAILSERRLFTYGIGKTHALLTEVAIELAPQLSQPRWELVTSIGPGGVQLYEAFASRPTTQPAQPARRGRFARLDDDTEERGSARLVYVLSLAAVDRSDDALAELKREPLAASLDYIAREQLAAEAHRGRLVSFMLRAIEDNLDSPMWEYVIELAAIDGRSEDALALARQAAERNDLSPTNKQRVRSTLIDALLASGKSEEAVEMLRAAMSDAARPDADVLPDDEFDHIAMVGGSPSSNAAGLYQLGKVLDRADWREQALSAMLRQYRQQLAMQPHLAESSARAVASMLQDADRSAEAIQLVADLVVQKARGGARRSFGSDSAEQTLIGLYSAIGRHEDVLALLRGLPTLGASDVKDLIERSHRLTASGMAIGQSIPYYAAVALARTGQSGKARELLHAMINAAPGSDAPYALLLEVDGPAARDFLDLAFARDAFEERPLIWKAELLRRIGDLDRAEATARQAIAIDPSDGEQPHGDRMRVYAVLAGILADKGKADDAAFLREVVAAIRQAEHADRLIAAGLTSQGLDEYRRSLERFADAYCIQSRLARELSQRGLWEEAEKHYRRAFELMPDSFGRIESHCFGCEGAFSGKVAQNIAEKVFEQLIVEQPDKAQVWYLMGYLRESQDNDVEAVKMYRRAVQIDPDYLNAWKRLISLDAGLTDADREAGALAMLRLDPLNRHGGHGQIGHVRDVRALWPIGERIASLQPAPVADILELTASKKGQAEQQQWNVRFSSSARAVRSPQELLLRVPHVGLIVSAIDPGAHEFDMDHFDF